MMTGSTAGASVLDMDDRALTQARFHGTVLWFDMAKGFGFIVPDDQPEQRVFVEHSCIDLPGYRVLTERQRVVFTFEPEVSSARATWVRPL